MTHGYSLRPNAKGRRGHQRSTDDPDGQLEGTNTSTSTCGTSEGHDLTDESDPTTDPCPTTPYDASRSAAHNPPPIPTPNPEHQRIEENQQQRSRSDVTSTTTATHHTMNMGYSRGGGGVVPRETWEEIQAGRMREEARRYAEAVRIRREQVVRGFEEEMRALRARIVALRGECEVRVARVRRRWERALAIERGEVVVVVAEEEEALDPDSDSDSDGEMEVEHNYAPTETSMMTDDEQWQQQWPSRSPPPRWSSRSETNFHFPPPSSLRTESRKTMPQQSPPPYIGGISPSSGMVVPSRLEPELEAMEERSRPSLPHPLRRQPAQLMVIPTSSHGSHTHGTVVQDPESRFYETDGDNDSEMGEVQ